VGLAGSEKMGKLTSKDIRNLERIIGRFLIRAAALERKIHTASTEAAHERAVNAWENNQTLIAEARALVAQYSATAAR
jgi:hypothetical protein